MCVGSRRLDSVHEGLLQRRRLILEINSQECMTVLLGNCGKEEIQGRNWKMPQGWKGIGGACVQRQKNLIIITNVRGHSIPLSPFLSKPEVFCLSLSYLEFNRTHTESDDIFKWYPWPGCHLQGLSPGSRAARNPPKPPRFHSNLILATNSVNRKFQGKKDHGGEHTQTPYTLKAPPVTH